MGKKTETGKHVKVPDEVTAKSSEMHREITKMKAAANALVEDCDATKKEQMLKEAESLLKDREAYVNEERRKALEAAPPIKTCDDCGTAYQTEAEYNNHLGFARHTSFVQIKEKIMELRANKEKLAAKTSERSQDDKGAEKDTRDK